MICLICIFTLESKSKNITDSLKGIYPVYLKELDLYNKERQLNKFIFLILQPLKLI